jgi:hypothetical protein
MGSGQGVLCELAGESDMGTIVKFPDEGRIVRFVQAGEQEESATVIILPVIRIERYADASVEIVEPRTQPPTGRGRSRRSKRP